MILLHGSGYGGWGKPEMGCQLLHAAFELGIVVA